MDYSYQRNEIIIRNKTREFFGVGTVVTASNYLVLVIDFMLIGGLLGADAVASAGLCDSFIDFAEFPGFVISSGGPILASILLGKRQYDRANQVFTLSFIMTLIGSFLCYLMLPFCGLLGRLLTNNGQISGEVARYAFFVLLSSPFVGLELVLSEFAVLDNHSRVAMKSIATANIVNIILDVVFMKVLSMGVSGASLASLLGNLMGILVCLPYLFSKRRTLHFSFAFRGIKRDLVELFKSCTSFAVDKVSRIVSVLIVNLLLMYFVGSISVALYALYGRLKFILIIFAGGALQTISSLGSMLYGERDYFGFRKMTSLLLKYTYSMVAVLEIALFLFSKEFLLSYGIEPFNMTLVAFRIMLLSLPIFWLNDLLSRIYPTIERQNLSVLLHFLQNIVFRIGLLFVAVFFITRFGFASLIVVSLWCLIVELFSLTSTLILEKKRYKNIAILDMKDFVAPECHTFSIRGRIEDVDNVQQEIESFCSKNGISRKKGTLLALAFEEVVLYIINNNSKADTIDICLFLENGNIVVRIRDNGSPFNPLIFVDELDILRLNNINLLDKLTNQKAYTRILNMNNTVLSVKIEDEKDE